MEPFEKIINIIKNLTLDEKEKSEILSKISSYMKEHPISAQESIEQVVSPYVKDEKQVRHMWYSSLKSQLESKLDIRFAMPLSLSGKLFMPTVIILIMLGLGGSASLAANSSLPGDTLYPIKINVNEKLESFLALGAEADARVAARQADERLEETEKLVVRGSIEMKTKENIKARFTEHALRVEELSLKLKEKGNLEAAAALDSRFESSLRVHNLVLAELLKNEEDDKDDIEEINSEVRIRLSNASKARVEGEEKISSQAEVSTKAAAEGSLQASKNKIEEVEGYIMGHLEAEAQARALVQLDIAKKIRAEGEAKLEAGAYGEAFVLFHRAMREAQEAKLWLVTENSLKININPWSRGSGGSQESKEPRNSDNGGEEKENNGNENSNGNEKEEGEIEAEVESEGLIRIDL